MSPGTSEWSYHVTQNWIVLRLISLKIKLIYNQFSPHLSSDPQGFLWGTRRIQEVMGAGQLSEAESLQTCTYSGGCLRAK